MPDIALDKWSILAVFVESVLWGLCFSIYLVTVFLLLQKKNVAKYVPHLALTSVMFILCTTHVSLSFARLIDAFFRSPNPSAYLADITNVTFRFKNAVLFIQVFIGNLLIVFRCFMHWNKNYFIVIVPALLTVGTFVSAGGALQAMSVSSHTALIFDGQVKSWTISILALTLATQTICLLLVLSRLPTIHASITSHVNRHVIVYTFMVVLVDSGAFAFCTSAVLLPAFVAKQNVQYIVSDALSPVMALTCVAIIAGMTVQLANPGPALALARPAWHHRSVRRPPSIKTARLAKVQWHDFEEDTDVPTTSTSSPVLSRATSIHHANKSTGTLNMSIVI